MKPIFIVLLLLAGCKTSSYFLTPNEMQRAGVTLVYTDGREAKGLLTVSHENYNSIHSTYDKYIDFIPEGKDSSMRVSMLDLAGYWHESDFYALRKVDITMDGNEMVIFLKRLTDSNSRIQLYELHESGRGNQTGEEKYSYYLSFSSTPPLVAINTRSVRFLPDFDRKMSLMVSDCPKLANKILSRENGYNIPMASFNRKIHPEVMMRIIREYNQCLDTTVKVNGTR